MAGWIGLIQPFTTVFAWELLWSLSVTDEDNLFRDYFEAEWGLVRESLELMPDVFVDCIVWDALAQIELQLVITAVDSVDSVDCKYTTGKFALP